MLHDPDDDDDKAKGVLLAVYVAGSGVCMGEDDGPKSYYKHGQSAF